MPKPWLTLTVKLATRAGRVQEREEASQRERLVRRIATDPTGHYSNWRLHAAIRALRVGRKPDQVQPAGYALHDFQEQLVERWRAERAPLASFLLGGMTWHPLP